MSSLPTSYFRCLAPFLKAGLIALLIFSVFRLWYIVWQFDRVSATGGIEFILFQGFRFDLMTIAQFILLPAIMTPFFFLGEASGKIWNKFLRVYLSLLILFFLVMELTTTNFIDQYDARPNLLFVEYLSSPREVFSMLLKAYPYTFLSAALVLPICVFLSWQTFQVSEIHTLKFRQALSLSIILFIVLGLCARSSINHRPANPSIVAFSTDLMANELALNSSYSLAYAIYETRRDKEGGFTYGQMPKKEMLSIVKNNMSIDDKDFISGNIPTLHKNKSTYPRKQPLNIVVILQESLGAEFVGSLGGLPLTPNIDALAKESWWFENLYATGTRSVRGIEGVITGFTPTPSKAVVKLNKSQRNFFTFASALKQQGYNTSFIYGGEAHFDNMQRFFMNNGFESVIDQNDYINPIFTGSWGVSDEDLFNKADSIFSQQHDKPFFSLVFSSSNHSPFEFPDGRIGLYDHDKATVNNAVKYADYALGQFFKKAKTSNYWDNTIFLVVADHNSRVFGANLVPIERFHIPGFILGKNVPQKQFLPVTSQIDLLPTVLSLAGVDYLSPAIGHDLTKITDPNFLGRAMMQYNTTQAYMEGDKVTLLEKDKKPKVYLYKNKQLIFSKSKNDDLVRKALAHSLFGTYMYSKNLYRTP